MGEKVWRVVFLAELMLLAMPLSALLAAWGLAVIVPAAFTNPSAVSVAMGSFTLVALVALTAGWVLAFRFLYGGVHYLAASSLVLWFAASAGALIVLAALVSTYSPQPEPYTSWWAFRQDFSLFLFGAPALVPLAHLVTERLRHMGANYSLKRTAANRRGVD